jgi:hypothetical protein
MNSAHRVVNDLVMVCLVFRELVLKAYKDRTEPEQSRDFIERLSRVKSGRSGST